jgi:hypothetical protein
LSETLPNKNKKHRNHYQKHYQRRRRRRRRRSGSITRNITKFLDTQKYKYHIVKQKTFSAIPCFLPHEPKRREKTKKMRTWKTKQNIEGLVFTCLEGGASPEVDAAASVVKAADDAIAMAASPGRPRC